MPGCSFLLPVPAAPQRACPPHSPAHCPPPRAVDCVATRLWFDRPIPTRFPANVLAGFEQDCGATYFNLSQLQARF